MSTGLATNTFAEMVDGWMLRERGFRRRKRKDGEFEASLRAPRGSSAESLIVFTDRGNLWVRFSAPNMCYPADSRAELRSILRALSSDRALFVNIFRGEKWEGVTLVPRGQRPALKRGQVAHVVCWSGRYDEVVTLKMASQVSR